MSAAVPITVSLTQLVVDVVLATPVQGDIFFRGATKWNNLPAGTSGQFLKTLGAGQNPVWATVPAATPGGSSGQLQVNDGAGGFGGAAFSAVAGSGNLLTLTAATDADVPLTLAGHSGSQSGNLLVAGVSAIGPTGHVGVNCAPALTSPLTVNTTVTTDIIRLLTNGTVVSFLDYQGNYNSVSGGFISQGSGGNCKVYLGGVLTITGDSVGSNYTGFIDSYNKIVVRPGVFGGGGPYGMAVISQHAGDVPFAIAGAASQAAPLLQLQDNSSNVWGEIGAPNTAANTSFDGLTLINPLPATSGNQRWSPRTHWGAQGFKTTSVAGSQQVDFIAEVQTVQGTTSPSGNFVISSQINGGGYVAALTINPSFLLSHYGTDQNLAIFGPANLANGITCVSVNDAGNANLGMELQAGGAGFRVSTISSAPFQVCVGGSNNASLHVSTAGLAFYGVPPVARQSGDIATGLVALGLFSSATGGGGISIGDAVGSGTANYALFVDGSGNLGQDANFQWNAGAQTLSLMGAAGAATFSASSGNYVVTLANAFNGWAAHFYDGTNSLSICDGTNHISYTDPTPANWSGAPTDVWIAVARLAAAVQGLLGGAIP